MILYDFFIFSVCWFWLGKYGDSVQYKLYFLGVFCEVSYRLSFFHIETLSPEETMMMLVAPGYFHVVISSFGKVDDGSVRIKKHLLSIVAGSVLYIFVLGGWLFEFILIV
jgi:hypothetical protein